MSSKVGDILNKLAKNVRVDVNANVSGDGGGVRKFSADVTGQGSAGVAARQNPMIIIAIIGVVVLLFSSQKKRR